MIRPAQSTSDPFRGPEAVIYRAADGSYVVPGGSPHFQMREVGIAAITGGAWTVRIFKARRSGNILPALHRHNAEFQYVHVVAGSVEFQLAGGRRERLGAGDSIYQPQGCVHCVTWISEDLELLEIFSPAEIDTFAVVE